MMQQALTVKQTQGKANNTDKVVDTCNSHVDYANLLLVADYFISINFYRSIHWQKNKMNESLNRCLWMCGISEEIYKLSLSANA